MTETFSSTPPAWSGESVEPLTAVQIRDAPLPDARFGSRGYDKSAVEHLLTRVAADVEHYQRTIQALQVSANAMAVEVTHRRGGYLPDHSLADLRISAQIDAMRHSEELISVAQNHARDLVNSAKEQAAALLSDGSRSDDVATLRHKLSQYQQLAHTMNSYLQQVVGVLNSAHVSFAGKLSAIDSAAPDPAMNLPR